MTFFINIFRRPTFITLVLGVFFVIFILKILNLNNYEKAQKDIRDYLVPWNYEITENTYTKNNIDYVNKIAQGLHSMPIESYKLEIDGKEELAWSENNKSTIGCNPYSTTLTLLGGIRIGKFDVCISTRKVKAESISSPIFLLSSFVVIMLVLLSSIWSLKGYKKVLDSTILSFKRWSADPTQKLALPLNDNVTREIQTLFDEAIEKRAKINQLNTDLESEKKVSRIIKQVAHDIRKPIITAQKKLKLQISDSEKMAELIPTFEKIYNISDDLLNPNSNNAYRINKIIKVDIVPIIKSAIKDQSILYPDIKFNLKGSDCLSALCAPIELDRVMTNLITNAAEALTSSKDKIVTIDLKPFERRASISIMDTGRGISDENLDFIFEDGYTSGKEDGHGLGLNYVKNVVTNWGGEVAVNSKMDMGSTFTLYLNLAKDFYETHKNEVIL